MAIHAGLGTAEGVNRPLDYVEYICIYAKSLNDISAGQPDVPAGRGSRPDAVSTRGRGY